MAYQLTARVYPAHEPVRLIFEPVFPVKVDPQARYEVSVHAFSGLKRYKRPANPQAEALLAGRHPLTIKDGVLVFDLTLPQEDGYILRLYQTGLYQDDQEIDKIEIYALEADLFALTPYKGDQHLHTWMSDGRDSPMYMAAAACANGYDYCAVTDHKKLEPSLLARDYFAPTGVDFLVIPGEEVHAPDNPPHIISLGGKESVNTWWREQEPDYRARVEEELARTDPSLGQEDRYAAAASQVIFDKIREVDGISILCHPNWIVANGFHQHEDITDYLMEHRRFDVLELIAGGAYEDGTQMQLSYYQDQPQMPIVGNSDSHACFGGRLEPGNFTIVFARGLDGEAIKASLRQGLAIAGNQNKLYGDYRLVKYGYFLLRTYYPAHKEQRVKLGKAMLRYASARQDATDDMREALLSPRPAEGFNTIRYSRERL